MPREAWRIRVSGVIGGDGVSGRSRTRGRSSRYLCTTAISQQHKTEGVMEYWSLRLSDRSSSTVVQPDRGTVAETPMHGMEGSHLVAAVSATKEVLVLADC